MLFYKMNDMSHETTRWMRVTLLYSERLVIGSLYYDPLELNKSSCTACGVKQIYGWTHMTESPYIRL